MTVVEQIDKDVRRTLVKLSFFQQPMPYRSDSPLSPGSAGKSGNLYTTSRLMFQWLSGVDQEFTRKHSDGSDYHWEAVERILFIYSQLNKGVGYVQGMNEILAPLYYILANDSDQNSKGTSILIERVLYARIIHSPRRS